MKCIVTYYSAQQNLTAILTLLQAQLVLPEEIIIIDTSPAKTGLEIAQKFAIRHGGIPVKIECARVNIYDAWNLGLDLAGPNTDVVIMNDDLLIPINFIDILGLVAMNTNAYCIVPDTPARNYCQNMVGLPFGFYAKLPETTEDISVVEWMPGFCFYLSKECIKEVGNFDSKHFKIWFGDDDYQARIKKIAAKNNAIPILKINSMFIYHFGGKSYEYQSKEMQKIITRDRKSYEKKYNTKT